MSDLPSEFDLKLTPDWLKESPAANPYADFESKESERPRRGDRDDRERGSRPPQGRRSGGESRERRGAPAGGKGPPRGKDRPESWAPRGDRSPRTLDQPPQPRAEPANVVVEFLPEKNFLTSLSKQIRASGRAWPLFGLARLFLEKPERHRVRITSGDPALPLWQAGENGPVTLDRATAERVAFATLRATFYSEETIQREPPKGNFTRVARCRLSGTLLGPTNHHGYQPALRNLYEERFSRRMSFSEYLTNIESVSDPAAIEAWKEAARSLTVYRTVGEGQPQVFERLSDVEQHFRTHHLESQLRSGSSFELTGEASRRLPDRALALAVKQAWEKQRGFPGGMMHYIRRELPGLLFFKHRKRMQYITAIRPVPLTGGTLSANVVRILSAIEESPGCTRADLAHKALGENASDAAKSALAGDLRWLTAAGHVIEFHDGRLDLPWTKTESAREPGAGSPIAENESPSTGESDPEPNPAQPAPETLPPDSAASPLSSES
jgi:hypothetical protein